MKKLIQIAAATTLIGTGAVYASGNVENGNGMKGGAKYHKMIKGKKGNKKIRSVFLIKRGLPHYSIILKKYWNDPKLALTDKQKSKLLKIRKETLTNIKKLAPESIRLKRDIITGSRNGEDLETLQKMTDLLASIKSKATKIQLKCISDTKSILNKKQLEYLHHEMMKRMRKNMKKGQKAETVNR